MTVMDQYFKLSDEISKGTTSLETLTDLFDEQAVIEANYGNAYSGIESIKLFIKTFFYSSIELKHIWKTKSSGNVFEVEWGVVGKRKKSENIFILKGTDFATVNPTTNKITKLRVVAE